MKRFCSLILAFCLVIASFPYVIAVSSDNTISCGKTFSSADGLLCVPVQIENNTGVMGYSIKVGYNKNGLLPVSVTLGEFFSTGSFNDSIGVDVPGSFKVVWTNSENNYDDGVMFVLSFRVLANASASESIAISYNQDDTFDESWQDVVFHCVNGSVTTDLSGVPACSNSVSAHSAEVMAGEQFDLPVQFESMSELMGFSIVISYDSTVFTPVDISRGSAFTSGSMNDNREKAEGHLKVVWTGTENVAANGTAFVATFSTNSRAESGQHTFEISYIPADTFNETWQDVVLNCQDTTVTVRAHLDNYVYPYGNIVQESSHISIPVAIKNNQGFMGLAIVIAYDKNVFTPLSVDSGAVLSNGSVNDSIGVSAPGSFRVVYTASGNVSEDGILFTIDFAISKTAHGNSTIVLSYAQADTFNEQWEDVVFACENVVVEIDNPEIKETPYLYSDGISVQAGCDLTVPIVLENGSEVSAFSLSLQYDYNLLTPISVAAGAEINGDVTSNIVTAQPGSLTVAWRGETPALQDGTVIQIVFFVHSSVQTNSEIVLICDDVSSIDGNELTVLCDNINISVSNPDANKPAQLYTESITAVVGDTVSIPVLIRNNQGIMGFGVTVSYDASVLSPVSVAKGSIIQNGTFDTSIEVAEQGCFKIVWNGNEDIAQDGQLFVLQFAVSADFVGDNTIITLAYSTEDTFNEKWENVAWECDEVIVHMVHSGDANEDGEVNLQDVVLITRWLAGGWNVTISEINSDVNRDGEINLKDAVLIRRFLAGGWEVTLR